MSFKVYPEGYLVSVDCESRRRLGILKSLFSLEITKIAKQGRIALAN